MIALNSSLMTILVLAVGMRAGAEPIRTEVGFVDGTAQGGIDVYKGIPFAAPPVGDLRWKAPSMPQPWSGVRKADHFAPACAQIPTASASATSDSIFRMPELRSNSEDCLYLNIWTPAKSPSDRLPVMVWIYGGGFVQGGTAVPVYDGTSLAKKGVVLVSIAYRLGLLGFLAHPQLSAESGHGSGNYGLLDQIASLKWIQRNIAAFGGDSHRVTIFGESAGGISVSMLAASPRATGLFQRAIAESGASFGPARYDGEGGVYVAPLSVAERGGARCFSFLGVKSVEEARKLPVETILKAAAADELLGSVQFPNFDGYVLTGDQYELYRAGLQNDTPILIGTNADEGATFPHPNDAASYVAAARVQYGAYTDKILAAYPAGSDEQAANSSRDLWRDASLAWHTWAWARLQERTGTGRAYVYNFNHRPPLPDVPLFKEFGAIHGAEVAYVFGNLFWPATFNYTTEDHALSDAMTSYWTNFAKSGNPNGPGLPLWPEFSARRPLAMHFEGDAIVGLLSNLRRLRVLEGYYAWRRSQAAGKRQAKSKLQKRSEPACSGRPCDAIDIAPVTS
jgi:para-nitrobenzyl esterase